MPLIDSAQVRQRLINLLPGLKIDGVPKASGQRLVYFVSFDVIEDAIKGTWGNCVLKVMLAPSTDSISRFQREIRVLNEIESKAYPKHLYNNIFSEDPVNEDALIPPWFITIEKRVAGEPLRSILDRPIDELRVRKILIELIEALELLWNGNKEYVHRDLSPENILIDNSGDIKIIDLGLIRETGEIGYTQDLFEVGPCNPKYCSPEQSINDKANISYKSDFFILGILMYEMLAGEHPFWDKTIANREQMLNAIRNKNPKDLASDFNISQPMKEIVDKMISKKPFERYRRPDDLKHDLRNLGGPIV